MPAPQPTTPAIALPMNTGKAEATRAPPEKPEA